MNVHFVPSTAMSPYVSEYIFDAMHWVCLARCTRRGENTLEACAKFEIIAAFFFFSFFVARCVLHSELHGNDKSKRTSNQLEMGN